MSHGVFKGYYGVIFKRTNSMDMADVCNAIVLYDKKPFFYILSTDRCLTYIGYFYRANMEHV